MAQARAALSGKWGAAITVEFGYAFFNTAIPCLLVGMLNLGKATYYTSLIRGAGARQSILFAGLSRFFSSLWTFVLMLLFLLLWNLIPFTFSVFAIVAALAYSMTFFIMADDPSVGGLAAITRSKEMMKGMKWKLFCLYLRFFGWIILSILTCFVGFVWLIPYMACATARFYEDVKGRVVA